MSGSEGGYHLTVYKNIFEARERFWGPRVVTAAGHPLPQLIGDVGRSCGDASCALLFCAQSATKKSINSQRKTPQRAIVAALYQI
jgi:hypothetical protein